jgi:polysaccharide pyruvyl transferase WcaK-like protein
VTPVASDKRGPRRLLLLADNSDQNNWGAQATPYGIRRILGGVDPELEVDALAYRWLTQRERVFDRGPARGKVFREPGNRLLLWLSGPFSDTAQFFPQIADEFEYYADEWSSGRGGRMASEFTEALTRCDAVVYNAENAMYRNSPAGTRSLFLLWYAKTRLGKPSGIINQTAMMSHMPVPTMPGMVKLVYPVLDLVLAREPASWKDLREFGMRNARLVPDVVFYCDETDFEERRFGAWKASVGVKPQEYFCFGASSLPMDKPRKNDEGAVTGLVAELKRSSGQQCVLLAKDSHCQFLKEVASLTGSIFFGPEHSFQELWPLFRDASFLVSGHFHYIIMGAMVGCPYIPLSTNNHKTDGVNEHLNWHRRECFDATALRCCTPAIVTEAEMLLQNRDRLSAQLSVRSAELRREAAETGRAVSALTLESGKATRARA